MLKGETMGKNGVLRVNIGVLIEGKNLFFLEVGGDGGMVYDSNIQYVRTEKLFIIHFLDLTRGSSAFGHL
jgi:hypothetical protein